MRIRLSPEELVELIVASKGGTATIEAVTAELLRLRGMPPDELLGWFRETTLKAHKELKKIVGEVAEVVDDEMRKG